MYIWQRDGWPNLSWNDPQLAAALTKANKKESRLLGKMEALSFEMQGEACLQTLTQDVVKSSEIEGEKLDSDQVRSSIARRLGMDIAGLVPTDRNVEGVVEMMLDATQNYQQALTEERLFAWHAALFPTGFSGMQIINAGCWRTDNAGPMQVISGPVGRERVHYEAPPAEQIPNEITRFLNWFNAPADIDPLLKAGLAHLWFVTIHPFDDGNGRIARAITDMALAQGEDSPQRSYSMSAQIRLERKDYYALLESSQKATLDITAWQAWFLDCLTRAIDDAQIGLGTALKKAHFWEKMAKESLNERQILVLQRVMREDWEGKLTSSKWVTLTRCGQATAGRDINDLIKKGVLRKDEGGGRSTSYSIVVGGQ